MTRIGTGVGGVRGPGKVSFAFEPVDRQAQRVVPRRGEQRCRGQCRRPDAEAEGSNASGWWRGLVVGGGGGSAFVFVVKRFTGAGKNQKKRLELCSSLTVK